MYKRQVLGGKFWGADRKNRRAKQGFSNATASRPARCSALQEDDPLGERDRVHYVPHHGSSFFFSTKKATTRSYVASEDSRFSVEQEAMFLLDKIFLGGKFWGADRKNRRAKQNNSHNQVRCTFSASLPYRSPFRAPLLYSTGK